MKRRLSVEEHIVLGNLVKQLRRRLDAVVLDLDLVFPRRHRANRLAAVLSSKLWSLQSELDDEVCRLVPRERDGPPGAIHVYYGDDFTPTTSNDNHAFAGWTDETPRETLDSVHEHRLREQRAR